MITTLEALCFSILSAMMLLMVLCIIFSILIPTLDSWNKKFFVTVFSLRLICVIAFVIDMILYKDPNMVEADKIAVFIEFLSLMFLAPMSSLFLLRSCGENMKESFLFRVVFTLFCAGIVMLIIDQFTDIFSYVTANNEFVRGPLYGVMLAPLILTLCFTIAGVIIRRKKLTKNYFVAMLVYLLPITTALCIHTFVDFTFFVIMGMVVSTMSMYILIISDNLEQYMKQKREIAHQQAGLMVLQMRPHFIYNTMMSIYYLCKIDSDKAQEVTLDFTTYLRRNFTAIASDKNVPFSEELEHTRAYLAVEQAQLDDRIFVDYDTPHTDFLLPPLTMQPLVENCVKHGMTLNGDPLHIFIRTRKTDEGSEIIVENDGSNFKPIEDDEPHIALSNIKQRLKIMCNGTIKITPLESGGTRVTVCIPK